MRADDEDIIEGGYERGGNVKEGREVEREDREQRWLGRADVAGGERTDPAS